MSCMVTSHRMRILNGAVAALLSVSLLVIDYVSGFMMSKSNKRSKHEHQSETPELSDSLCLWFSLLCSLDDKEPPDLSFSNTYFLQIVKSDSFPRRVTEQNVKSRSCNWIWWGLICLFSFHVSDLIHVLIFKNIWFTFISISILYWLHNDIVFIHIFN